ncbi:MAG: hypothetical protein D6815_07950, partial [Candidatus Dadabacteria bacterium]
MLSLTVALAVSLTIGAPGVAWSQDPLSPGVRRAVERAGEAEVVVALRSVAARGLRARTSAIAEERDRVLRSLPGGAFRPTQTWEAVPGMRGIVTAAGLDALAGHPDVVAVSLPGFGTAHLAESVPLIGANTVHTGGNTGAGTEVAVID